MPRWVQVAGGGWSCGELAFRESAMTASYMRPTKSMEHHYSNAEQDAVRCAFLPSSFVQIRKLPAKMKAGTLGSGGVVLSEGSASARGRTAGPSGRLWSGGLAQLTSQSMRQRSGLSLSEGSLVEGTLSPRRFPVGPKMFSMYTYMPSDYDLPKQLRAIEKERDAAKIIGPPCIKTGTPTIPDKQGTFTHFRYEIDPYESKDEYWNEVRVQDMKAAIGARAFTPASARAVAKDDLHKRKASQHELLARLVATLQADWPDVFRRCFLDKNGLIVCLFTDYEQDSGRSELFSYMHQLIKTHPVSTEFMLRKQSARWGRHSNGFIEFAIQPPWVLTSPYEHYLRSHLEEAAKLQSSNKVPPRSRVGTAAPPSRRMAVPPQTPNGTRIYSYLGGDGGHINM